MMVTDDVDTPRPRRFSLFGTSRLVKKPRGPIEDQQEGSTVKFIETVEVQEYSQSEYDIDSSSNEQYQEARQRVFEIVEKHYPEQLNALRTYLQTELTDLRRKTSEFKYPFTIHPSASYFLHQYILCCTELVLRLDRKKISYRNFRDFAANLSALYEVMVARADTNDEYINVAMLMSWTLWNLFEAWDCMAMVFEDVHHKQTTDWIAVAARIRNVFEGMHEKPDIEVVSKPPVDLSSLDAPYLIGNCAFGTLHFSQLGRVPLLVRAASRTADMHDTRRNQMRVFSQSACQLRHPLLERFLATCVIGDTYVACSETLFGITLSQVVQKVFSRDGCPLELTRILIAQVGLALFYLHFQGNIHLDIKAVNVMVSSTCRVKLIGIESAKLCVGIHHIKRKREFFRRTARELMGKENVPDPVFAPPEVLRNLPYGRAVDWWYLGALAFFMYYNRTPFQGEDEDETRAQILRGRLRMKKTSARGFKHFKSFIHDTLNPKPKSRLCSKSYGQFLKHRFFHGIIWEVLEKSNAIVELFEVENHMEPHEGYWTPPHAEFQSGIWQDFDDGGLILTQSEDSNLCYATAAMRRSLKLYNRDGYLEDILWEENEVEWLPLKEVKAKDSGYKFRNYFKKNRIPRQLAV